MSQIHSIHLDQSSYLFDQNASDTMTDENYRANSGGEFGERCNYLLEQCICGRMEIGPAQYLRDGQFMVPVSEVLVC